MSKIETLHAAELDGLGCSTPNCKHDHSEIIIHAACHPHSAVRARYIKAERRVIFKCWICDKPLCAVAVA